MLTKQELRQLPDKDLRAELSKATHSLLKIRMDLQEGYAKESSKAAKLQKYIAQIKTFQREHEIEDQLKKTTEPKTESPSESTKK